MKAQAKLHNLICEAPSQNYNVQINPMSSLFHQTMPSCINNIIFIGVC